MPPTQSIKTLHSTKPCIDKTLVLCPHRGAGVNICVVLSSKAGNQPALLGLSLWGRYLPSSMGISYYLYAGEARDS